MALSRLGTALPLAGAAGQSGHTPETL